MIEQSAREWMTLLELSFMSFGNSFLDNLRSERIILSWLLIHKRSWRPVNKRSWLFVNNSALKGSSKIWEDTSEHLSATLLLLSLRKRRLDGLLIVSLGWTTANNWSLWLLYGLLWSNYWSWRWLRLFRHLECLLYHIWYLACLLLFCQSNVFLYDLRFLSLFFFLLLLLLDFLLEECLSFSSFFLLCSCNSARNDRTFLFFLLMGFLVHLFLNLIHSIHDLGSVLFFFLLFSDSFNLCIELVLSINVLRGGIDNSLRRLNLIWIDRHC